MSVPAWWLLVVAGVAVLLVCALEAYHAEERRQMLDRLMSKDLADYKLSENGSAPKGRNWVRTGLDRSMRMEDTEGGATTE
jgi:hypothetical protein